MEPTDRRRLLSLAVALASCLAAAAAEPPLSRQWTIYVVAHPHVDMGYTELPSEVQRNWCARIDEAIAAAPRGLKWTLESSVLFDVYSKMRPPEKVAELVRLIREGKIEVAALYTSPNTESAGSEELVRSTFYASEELRRKYGVVVKTAMLSDVPGATWGLPRVLAGAGVRYFAFAPGRYKELVDLAAHPELFYWKSPDGSKVLTRLGTGKYFFYGAGVMLRRPKTIEQDVAEMLRHYESLGGAYPYDAVMLQDADDNARPSAELVGVVDKWNAAHANPRMILATPREFFEYVEEKYRNRIPELSGDFTSAWTDMPGNFAEATGVKRAAAHTVLAAERFATLAEALGTGFVYPAAQIRSVYENLLRYTDHTHGVSTWLWEHEPLTQSGGSLHAPVGLLQGVLGDEEAVRVPRRPDRGRDSRGFARAPGGEDPGSRPHRCRLQSSLLAPYGCGAGVEPRAEASVRIGRRRNGREDALSTPRKRCALQPDRVRRKECPRAGVQDLSDRAVLDPGSSRQSGRASGQRARERVLPCGG
jgi:hypothetical protein